MFVRPLTPSSSSSLSPLLVKCFSSSTSTSLCSSPWQKRQSRDATTCCHNDDDRNDYGTVLYYSKQKQSLPLTSHASSLFLSSSTRAWIPQQSSFFTMAATTMRLSLATATVNSCIQPNDFLTAVRLFSTHSSSPTSNDDDERIDNNNGDASATPPSSTSTLQQQQQQQQLPSAKQQKKVTTLHIIAKKRHKQKITMVTAYDYPSAKHVDRAGIDIVLVGDSCAMVELGFETTLGITLDEMIYHCQAVKRGAPNRPLLVGDMPFGSYEYNDVDVALRNAYRMVKEGGMDAVKVEGGTEKRCTIVQHLVQGGIAVMGHVGLTPQAINVLGGFRAQGRTAIRAKTLLEEALRLQDAGVFAIVLECIPANVAHAITTKLDIPTIGIGAGGHTSGQVLVFHDLLGMSSHPHHEEFVPKFCKRYASVGLQINDGLAQFKKEVDDGMFPGNEYSPYVMSTDEIVNFDNLLLTMDQHNKINRLDDDRDDGMVDSNSETLYGTK